MAKRHLCRMARSCGTFPLASEPWVADWLFDDLRHFHPQTKE